MSTTSDNTTPNTPGLIRMARAELAQARANACRHGLAKDRARCAECERVETKTETAATEETDA